MYVGCWTAPETRVTVAGMKSLDAASRSRLFLALARYSEAGMTLDAGLENFAGDDRRFAARAERAAGLMRGGLPLHAAGTRTGLFESWEAGILSLGAQHGRMDLALAELARHYERSAQWWGRLRAKLTLPAAVLLLGCVALPLPGVFAGERSIAAYLLGVAVVVVFFLWAWRGLSRAHGYPRLLDPLLAALPGRGLLWSYHRRNLLSDIAVLTEAGVPLVEGVQCALESCRSPVLRRRWRPVLDSLARGETFARSLRAQDALDAEGFALIDSGEASGKLVEMLRRERDRLDASIALQLDVLVDWLPRLVYVLVLLALFRLF